MATPKLDIGGLPIDTLVGLVREAQRQRLCAEGGLLWADYIKAKEPKSNFNDPARHKPGVLSGFLKSVTKAGGEGGCELLTHFAAWQQRIAKERRLRAFSCPPAPRTPLAPGTDTAAAAEAVWALVRATRSHHRYEDAYSFKSYLPGWRRVRRRIVLPADAAGSTVGSTHEVLDSDGEGGEGSAGVRPRLLAVDCEMCETEGDKKALLGVCVVDEEGQVLFKTLVRPAGRVLDYRSDITGVTEADMNGPGVVSFVEAQQAVRRLVLEHYKRDKVPTVLVGHSLHHDLAALKLDYQPVIDTSFIFSFQNLPDYCPGLRQLSLAVLGEDMSARHAGKHDSAEDAAVALRLVTHELGAGKRTPPLPPPDAKVDRSELCKLLIHSIPPGVTEGELLSIFSTQPPATVAATAAGGGTAGSKAAAAAAAGGGGEDSDEDSSSSDDSSSDGSSSSDDSSSSDSDSDDDSDGAAPATNKAVATPAAAAGAAQGSSVSSAAMPKPVGLQAGGIKAGKVAVVFSSPEDANLAFKLLVGPQTKDAVGLMTKIVTLSPAAQGKSPGGVAAVAAVASGKGGKAGGGAGAGGAGRVVKVRRMAGHMGLAVQPLSAAHSAHVAAQHARAATQAKAKTGQGVPKGKRGGAKGKGGKGDEGRKGAKGMKGSKAGEPGSTQKGVPGGVQKRSGKSKGQRDAKGSKGRGDPLKSLKRGAAGDVAKGQAAKVAKV